MPYLIEDEAGRSLDARIDVDGSTVRLHSRGGSTGGRPPRNEGYAPALLAICRRARTRPRSLERVLIDSRPAQYRPESDRLLLNSDEIETLDGDALAGQVRVRLRRFGQAPKTTGGNATKQVRFDFALPQANILELLRLRAGEFSREDEAPPAAPGRLGADDLRRVTALHVREAVDRLTAGENAPNFAASRDYDVLGSTGERLAPKKVYGLALERALGMEAFPGQFSAGWGTPCFNTILEAGFAIVPKAGDGDAGPRAAPEPVLPEREEQSWAEGSPRFAQHLRRERRRSRQAIAAKRAQVRAANGGRLACENPRCTTDWYAIFPIAAAEGVFEVHHNILISEMDEDHQTSIEDLVCFCASCHRAEHRRIALADLSTTAPSR